MLHEMNRALMVGTHVGSMSIGDEGCEGDVGLDVTDELGHDEDEVSQGRYDCDVMLAGRRPSPCDSDR